MVVCFVTKPKPGDQFDIESIFTIDSTCGRHYNSTWLQLVGRNSTLRAVLVAPTNDVLAAASIAATAAGLSYIDAKYHIRKDWAIVRGKKKASNLLEKASTCYHHDIFNDSDISH